MLKILYIVFTFLSFRQKIDQMIKESIGAVCLKEFSTKLYPKLCSTDGRTNNRRTLIIEEPHFKRAKPNLPNRLKNK